MESAGRRGSRSGSRVRTTERGDPSSEFRSRSPDADTDTVRGWVLGSCSVPLCRPPTSSSRRSGDPDRETDRQGTPGVERSSRQHAETRAAVATHDYDANHNAIPFQRFEYRVPRNPILGAWVSAAPHRDPLGDQREAKGGTSQPALAWRFPAGAGREPLWVPPFATACLLFASRIARNDFPVSRNRIFDPLNSNADLHGRTGDETAGCGGTRIQSRGVSAPSREEFTRCSDPRVSPRRQFLPDGRILIPSGVERVGIPIVQNDYADRLIGGANPFTRPGDQFVPGG
jgi:hypothetical protein